MPRDEAQARVKQLCADAIEQGASLTALVAREYPDIDWASVATPLAQLGDAPAQARGFAASVRGL